MPGLFMVRSHGYPDIYVMADNFDQARKRWLDWVNEGEEEQGRIEPMPDTIAFIAVDTEVLI